MIIENDRWALVKTIISEWWPPLQPSDGNTPEEIAACEARLNLKLPLAMKEWYALAGRRDDFIGSMEHWKPLEKLGCRYIAAWGVGISDAPAVGRKQGEMDVLAFCIENQACATWGIDVADFEQDDPAVLVDPDRGTWEVETANFSTFILLQIVIATTVFAQDNKLGSITCETSERIRREFSRIATPDDFPGSVWGDKNTLIYLAPTSNGGFYLYKGIRLYDHLCGAWNPLRSQPRDGCEAVFWNADSGQREFDF